MKARISAIVSIITFVVGSLIMWSFTNGKDETKEIQKELQKKASMEYVNSQDILIRLEIEKNAKDHEMILKLLLEKQKEDRYNFEEIRRQLYKK